MALVCQGKALNLIQYHVMRVNVLHVKVDVKRFKFGHAHHRVRVRGSVHVYLVCEVVILA